MERAIGLYSNGTFQIGYNNTGNASAPTLWRSNHRIGQCRGLHDIGVPNDGDNLIGFPTPRAHSDWWWICWYEWNTLSEPIILSNRHCLHPKHWLHFTCNRVSLSCWCQFSVHCRLERGVSFQFGTSCNFDGCWFGMPGISSRHSIGPIHHDYDDPQPAPVYNCTGLTDGDEALADPFYSRNFRHPAPGLHILTFSGSSSGTALVFRVDSIRPPETVQMLLARFHQLNLSIVNQLICRIISDWYVQNWDMSCYETVNNGNTTAITNNNNATQLNSTSSSSSSNSNSQSSCAFW